MSTMTSALPTFDVASHWRGDRVVSFDLHGHVDAATVDEFLSTLTVNPDMCEAYGYGDEDISFQSLNGFRDDDDELPSCWYGFDVEHMWRYTACTPDMHESDEDCRWKGWHYIAVDRETSAMLFATGRGDAPTDPMGSANSSREIGQNDVVAVTRLTPVRAVESLHGQCDV